MTKALFLLVSFLMTSPLVANTVHFNQQRSITLAGVIDETTLGKSNDLLAFAETSKEPIDVLIASPGGVISYGLYFIQAMKVAQSHGVKVRCFVPQLAASMAYTIFTQCSERYALPYATLLFHSPRISGNFTITPSLAMGLAKGLTEIEAVLLKLIVPAMGITEESGAWFTQNYMDETLFVANDLLEQSPKPWFTIVNKIDAPKTFNIYPDVWARANAIMRRQSEYIYVFSK